MTKGELIEWFKPFSDEIRTNIKNISYDISDDGEGFCVVAVYDKNTNKCHDFSTIPPLSKQKEFQAEISRRLKEMGRK